MSAGRKGSLVSAAGSVMSCCCCCCCWDVGSEDDESEPLLENRPTDNQRSPAQQFGVSLSTLKRNNDDVIPPVIRQCITYLRDHGMEKEGVFRRSASAKLQQNVEQLFNEGFEVDLYYYDDVILAACLVKSFLRQLPEPILTDELHDNIGDLHRYRAEEAEEKLTQTRLLLIELLPDDNYYLLKYVVHFLSDLAAMSAVNSMTPGNLATVVGPNLWQSSLMTSLDDVDIVNSFTKFLIEHYSDLFTK